jgi:hypothetical protein
LVGSHPLVLSPDSGADPSAQTSGFGSPLRELTPPNREDCALPPEALPRELSPLRLRYRQALIPLGTAPTSAAKHRERASARLPLVAQLNGEGSPCLQVLFASDVL